MLETFVVRMIIGILIVLIIFSYYLANKSGDDSGSWEYEPVLKVEIPRSLVVLESVVGFILIGVSLLVILFPDFIYGSFVTVAFPGDTFVQIAGIVIIIPGLYLYVSSERHLGRFAISDISVAKDHELISTGPYAKIRHPSYTAVILLSLSITLLLLNLILVIISPIIIVIETYHAKLEEELLASEDAFGEKYKTYMQRTGRFLPKF
ncbi:MAG: methyltransferase family protein [Candidatus Heimdallarchaeota archaeon]